MGNRRKFRRVGLVSLAAFLVLALCGTLAATDGGRDIRVIYRNIKLVVNGVEVKTEHEPFIYEGRVYVPARFVAEALGQEVQWDEAGNRVLIGNAPSGPVSGGGGSTGSGTSGSGSGSGAGNGLWRPFPDDHAWNLDISGAPVDPNSAKLVAGIGLNSELHPDFGTFWEGRPIGFSITEVPADQPKVPIIFTAYGDESDPGPYPVPPDAAVEGGPQSGGDRHVIVVDRANDKLYELYRAFPVQGGAAWEAESAAVWDLRTGAPRPQSWTSADAAGLPIYPGLVKFEEVEAGEIRHAIRFTAPRTRRAYVPPASHWASSNTSADLPPMGMRVRLKGSVDISRFSPRNQVILRALQKYGMILADNGSPWFFGGTHDLRWNDEELSEMKVLKGRDFEVVRMEYIVTPDNFGKAPTISRLTASGNQVRAGEPVTLTWSATNAQTATIAGIGTVSGGSVVVYPDQTKTYLLTVSNPFGTTSRTITVTVAE